MPITKGALALGSTIIGSGGGGDTSGIEDLINDYAKGRIICDTSTMQVGDAVRVRSVTTNEYIDKTVTIVGGYLVFNVLCKDYYKICMLQGGGHQITITGYDSENYVDINIFDGMIGTGVRVYPSITSGAPNSYTGNGIDLYFDDNINKWVLKSIGTIIYQNQQYTSGQTIEEWSGQVNILLEEIPTEIGGEYVEIGFGDLHRSNVLDKSTFRGIKGILNAGQETTQLQVGDEVHTLVDGSDWVMQIADVSATRVTLASKYLWKASTYSNTAKTYYSASSPIHDEVTSFLAKLPQADQDCIETITKPQHTPVYQNSSWSTYSDKIWLPNTWEVLGSSGSIGSYYGTPPLPLTQFPLFTTQANRVKTLASGGTAYSWWTCDGNAASYGGESYQGVNDLGNSAGYGRTVSNYLLPCCAIEADS